MLTGFAGAVTTKLLQKFAVLHFAVVIQVDSHTSRTGDFGCNAAGAFRNDLLKFYSCDYGTVFQLQNFIAQRLGIDQTVLAAEPDDLSA